MFNISGDLLLSIIVVLVLVLIGVLAFGFYGYIKSENGLKIGFGVDASLGPKSGEEKYIVFKGNEHYVSSPYPYGVGVYTSESFVPKVSDGPDSGVGDSYMWDSGAGQRSTAAAGNQSTIMGYDESRIKGKLPQIRDRDMPISFI
jgi:hypothetical protein